MSEQTVLGLGAGATILLAALFTVYWFRRWRWEKRQQEQSDLNEPLMNDDVHRVDVALRGATETTIACKHCGFENFHKALVCSMCSEAIGSAGGDDTKAHVGAAMGSTLVQTLESSDNAPLSRRLKRARRRREWTRRINADGTLGWQRASRTSGDLRFPGYAVLFLEDTRGKPARTTSRHSEPEAEAEPEPEAEAEPEPETTIEEATAPSDLTIVVHTSADELTTATGATDAESPPPSLITVDERVKELLALTQSTRLALTDSFIADASQLPLARYTNTDVLWRDVLSMSESAFPAKHAHFVALTSALIAPAEREVIKLNVRRATLLADSIEALSALPTPSVRSVMRIHFVDEAGVDAGGLQREWFVLLNDAVAATSAGVFVCANKAEQTLFLNAASHDLVSFFAVGRLIGRALLEGSVIGFHLSLPLLKVMLGLPVTFSDVEHYDPELYKNLLWILENDGVETLGLDFSVSEKRGDDVVTIDLIPNGRSIDVTDDNKDEYLERRFRYTLFESVSSQLTAFLAGFYEVIPQELLMIFDPEEFDYLLCGSDEIDVDDWKANTKVSSNLRGHPALVWFWEIVREMPNEYRQRLLHFATGSSRVPIAGFRALTSYDGRLCPFTLRGVPLKDDGYIWSHACFNRLDVPLHVVRQDLKAVMYAMLDTEMYGFTTD